MLNRDQELWAVALWVEKNRGAARPAYMAEQVKRLADEGDEAGVENWKTIADRFNQLKYQNAIN